MCHRSLPLLLVTCLLLIVGCSGCRPQSTEEPESKSAAKTAAAGAEKKKREPFESGELKVLPADDNLAAHGVKSGHWVAARNEWKSTQSDARLELAVAPVGLDGQPIPFGESGYSLEYSRPVVLPKGQNKSFELPCFVAKSSDPSAANRNVVLASNLRAGGSSVHDKGQLTNRLRPHQMHLVVLARRPDAFAYLKSLETVRPHDAGDGSVELQPDYVPVFPTAKSPVLLPSSSLMWTSIACVFWDGVDPELLSKEQQEAMVEWLHWGGQLIISGPGSLDSLGRSFLADYLPVREGRVEKMTQVDAGELDAHWGRALPNGRKEVGFPWSEPAALDVLRWSEEDLARHRDSGDAQAQDEEVVAGAAFVPGTAKLVVESRVGRGRIVVAAFSLSARPVVVWRSLDNFLNGCLLRRPGRSFPAVDSLESVRLSDRWADLLKSPLELKAGDPPAEPLVVGESDEQSSDSNEEHSLLNSRLRYFSRDASVEDRVHTGDQAGRWDVAGYQADAEAGVAGWSDQADVGEVALADLNRTAGILVPESSLVLTSLAAYLLVLVPMNWAFFRAIGRVEWAWLAVPVLSLLGTFAVVRIARLDIGFSRSLTEIAVVEMQAQLPRAHVTRFTGIYTALSEPFDLVFDRPSSLALPILQEFGKAAELVDRRRPLPFKQSDRLEESLVLEGLAIGSNSTAMVRSEQVQTLPGTLRYEPHTGASGVLDNGTGIPLRGVVAVRRNATGGLEFAAGQDLAASASVTLHFEPLPFGEIPKSLWAEAGEKDGREAAETDDTRKANLRVRHLLAMAANPARIYAGDLKVVAWFDDKLPGMKVRPEINEVNFRGMLLAHLRYGPLPAPDSDDNGPAETASEGEHD